MLSRNVAGEDYLLLLKTYMTKFNWGYSDLISEFPVVQLTGLFSIYMLNQIAHDPISEDEFTHHFIEAFPAALMEFQPTPYGDNPKRELQLAVTVRFIERFCEYFGLLELVRVKVEASYRWQVHFSTTELFRTFFNFNDSLRALDREPKKSLLVH